jgi:hypothetical protein
MTICPNHADVEGELQINNVKTIHKQGVNSKYNMSEEFNMENSLLFFELVYFNGEFSMGIRYVIVDIISMV